MERFDVVWQSISQNKYSPLYLESVAEYSLLTQPEPTNSRSGVIYSTISSTLQKPETCSFGLQLLNNYLDQFTLEIPDEKINLWTTLLLKVCFRNKNCSSILLYDILAKLIALSVKSAELRKTFGLNYIIQIYELLQKEQLEPAAQLAALHCIEKCLKSYPIYSTAAKCNIESFLEKFLDTKNIYIAQYCGKCYNHLLQLRGGGVQNKNYKEAWQSHQDKLLGSLHILLNKLFAKCSNYAHHETFNEKESNNLLMDLSSDPTERVAQLFIRFDNTISYLNMALREPFPVAKPIMYKKILNLISQGFSVTNLSLQGTNIIDNTTLGIILPKIHYSLLTLLNALVDVLGRNGKIYHQFLLNLFVDILKSSKLSQGSTNIFMKLRRKLYDIIRIWCCMMGSGSRCETIGDFIVQEILNDIIPTGNECVLKVSKGSNKNRNNKMQKVSVDKFKLKQQASGYKLTKEISEKQKLCISGLKCLNNILTSSTNYIKPNVIKAAELKLIHLCSSFYENHVEQQLLFENYNCRQEAYNVLYALLISPHHQCAPSSQTIYDILRTAYYRDRNENVRNQCGIILSSLEKIIHPQKESLLYPLDKDIQKYENVFANYDQLKQPNNESEIPIVMSETHSQNESLLYPTEKVIITNMCSSSNQQTQENHLKDTPIVMSEIVNTSYDPPEDNFQTKAVETKENEINCEIETLEPDVALAGIEEENFPEPPPKKSMLERNYDVGTILTDTVTKDETKLNLDDETLIADIEVSFCDELS